MNIHILQHESFESPAAIENWIAERGHNATYTRFYNFEKLPENIDFIDLLLIMGGPQSPNTTPDECPHFNAAAEIAFIKSVIDADKKVLGICLGAQLIGEALGAKVEHSPNKEIGIYEIMLTQAGNEDVITSLLPSVFEVGHWHGDMPGLTSNSEILAFSAGCPRQIVKYSPKVYGIQCHFEFTNEAIKQMIEKCGNELIEFAREPYVVSEEKLRTGHYNEMNSMLFSMLDNF